MIARPVVTALVVCVLATLPCLGAPRSAKVPIRPKVAAKRVSTKKTVKGKAPIRKYAKTPRVAVQPGSDRLRTVQEALIERGYMTSPATGIWDAPSIEAWKKLEIENKMKADGKIDSRLLIQLGLGPRYEADLRLPAPAGAASTVAADDSKLDSPGARLN